MVLLTRIHDCHGRTLSGWQRAIGNTITATIRTAFPVPAHIPIFTATRTTIASCLCAFRSLLILSVTSLLRRFRYINSSASWVRPRGTSLWTWWRDVFTSFVLGNLGEMFLGMTSDLQNSFGANEALNAFPISVIQLQCLQEKLMFFFRPTFPVFRFCVRFSYFSNGLLNARSVLRSLCRRGFLGSTGSSSHGFSVSRIFLVLRSFLLRSFHYFIWF